MLITRFNRLIHNKVIWICFAVLVCAAFIISGSSFNEMRNMNGGDPVAGTLRGEKVTVNEYQTAMFQEQGLGNRAPKTDAEKAVLQQEAWKRLAAKKPIESMGVTVTDEDVLSVIQEEFSVNGVFNKDRYRGILYEQLRMSEEAFESYLRDVIFYQKAAHLFESCVWTPPSEVDQRLTDLSDEFTLQYVLLDAEEMIEDPTVSESELKDFYQEHKESFEITEERQVRYVAFPITNHLTDMVVKEEDIQRYFQAHQQEFQAAFSNGIPSLTPDLKKQIELRLQYEGATDKARREAMTLATALVKGRTSAPSSEAFLSQAATLGVPVYTTAYFVADEPIPGIASREFNQMAFRLTEQRPISDPVLGASSVYLMDLLDHRGPRTPEYEEVATKVEAFAVFSKRYDAFRDKAKEVEKTMKTDLAKGQTFKSIAESYSLNVATTTAFSVYSPNVSSNDQAIIDAVDQIIVQLKAGDVTPLIPIKRGALLVYVASRTPADPLLLQGLKPQLLRSLNQYRAAAVMDDWKTFLLAQADLDDKIHKPVAKIDAATDTAAAPKTEAPSAAKE